MVTDKLTEARERLRHAHIARKDAATRLAQAENAAKRGAECAESANAQLEQHAQALDTVTSDLVEGVAHSLRAGEQAKLGHAALDELAAKRATAQARAELAQAAHHELTRDVEAARHALQAAEADVRECAVKLMAAEDDTDATKLQKTRERVRDLESRFRADASLPLMQLGAAFSHALEIASAPEKQTVPGYDRDSVHQRRRSAYLETLCKDAEATYEAIVDPGAPLHPAFARSRSEKAA